MKVVWCSPLPPDPTGVADYSAELIPELAKSTEVALLPPPWWRERGNADWLPPSVEILGEGKKPEPNDLLLIHLGNNPNHLWQLDLDTGLAKQVIVLHDLVLHHLLVEATAARGMQRELEERLQKCEGALASKTASGRRWGYQSRIDPFLFPATSCFIGKAYAVAVHSKWAAEKIKTSMPDTPVFQIPMSVAPPPLPREQARRLWRSRLGIGEQETVMLHLGYPSPEKGFDKLMRAAKALRELLGPNRFKLLLVGKGTEALAKEIDVTIALGWLSKEEMLTVPAAADIGVVIRSPSAGETSAAALRILACGTPVAVTAINQYLELPPNYAFRLTPGCEDAEIIRLVLRIARGKREEGDSKTTAEAAKWVAQNHSPSAAAVGYLNLIRRLWNENRNR